MPFNQNNDERLFVIGTATFPNSALANGLAISTNLTNNNVIMQNCRRSLRNDENTRIPNNIGTRNNERYSSLASFPGISGGPILRCRLGPNIAHKKCAIIGTNFGAERIFNQNNMQEFRNIINLSN
jgi:hypothetical protein